MFVSKIDITVLCPTGAVYKELSTVTDSWQDMVKDLTIFDTLRVDSSRFSYLSREDWLKLVERILDNSAYSIAYDTITREYITTKKNFDWWKNYIEKRETLQWIIDEINDVKDALYILEDVVNLQCCMDDLPDLEVEENLPIAFSLLDKIYKYALDLLLSQNRREYE